MRWMRAVSLGLGILGTMFRPAGAGPPDEPPPLEPPIEAALEAGERAPAGAPGRDVAILQDGDLPTPPPIAGPPHEAFGETVRGRDATRIEKAPPPPIDERPRGDRPKPEAAWVKGYWSWDPDLKDYTWVPGVWRIPPPGRFWVDGSWRRDDRGWSRVPGFWSARQTDRADWRTQGPPAAQPDEVAGPAPSPDHFFIAGHYAPDGDGVVWKPGFWARSQPGWDWVPARWVRQAAGWTYREGHWGRSRDALADAAPVPAPGATGLAGAAPAEAPGASSLDPAVEPSGMTSDAVPAPALPPPAELPAPEGGTAVAPGAPYVVRRPAFVAGPSPLVALADQLAGQSDDFARAVAANAPLLADSGGFVADGQRVRDAALRLRRAASLGDPAQVAWELRNVDAASQRLAGRLWRVAGARIRSGRVGPFIARALQMAGTNERIQELAP